MLYPSTFPTVRRSYLPQGSRSAGKTSVIVFKPEQGLYYPAVEYVTDKIRDVVSRSPGDEVTAIVVDASKLSDIDYTGIRSFVELAEELNKHDIRLVFTCTTCGLMEGLRRADPYEFIRFESSIEDVTDGSLSPPI